MSRLRQLEMGWPFALAGGCVLFMVYRTVTGVWGTVWKTHPVCGQSPPTVDKYFGLMVVVFSLAAFFGGGLASRARSRGLSDVGVEGPRWIPKLVVGSFFLLVPLLLSVETLGLIFENDRDPTDKAWPLTYYVRCFASGSTRWEAALYFGISFFLLGHWLWPSLAGSAQDPKGVQGGDAQDPSPWSMALRTAALLVAAVIWVAGLGRSVPYLTATITAALSPIPVVNVTDLLIVTATLIVIVILVLTAGLDSYYAMRGTAPLGDRIAAWSSGNWLPASLLALFFGMLLSHLVLDGIHARAWIAAVARDIWAWLTYKEVLWTDAFTAVGTALAALAASAGLAVAVWLAKRQAAVAEAATRAAEERHTERERREALRACQTAALLVRDELVGNIRRLEYAMGLPPNGVFDPSTPHAPMEAPNDLTSRHFDDRAFALLAFLDEGDASKVRRAYIFARVPRALLDPGSYYSPGSPSQLWEALRRAREARLAIEQALPDLPWPEL